MAIPAQSLSGSEVLRRGGVAACSNTWTSIKFDGTFGAAAEQGHTVPANHIITVTSMTFCEVGDADEGLSMYIVTNSQNIYIWRGSISKHDTFHWKDKFCLIGGDKLVVVASSSANVDVLINYIDQSWV